MLNYDCRYFFGDRPCFYNKEYGIKCDKCEYYEPISFKILIIKLDAVGDVLRTTSILPPLKAKYKKAFITWCTRSNARDLFQNNNYVDEVLIVEEDAAIRLSREEFNMVINLDSSKLSSSIAAFAKGKEKKGFLLNEKGSVIPTSVEADYWLQMSAFDEKKKMNNKTYQQIIYDVIGINEEVSKPILFVDEKITTEKAEEFKLSGYDRGKITIGLNIGVGTKWPSKGWPVKNWMELIEKLITENKFNLFLLGGFEEINLLEKLNNKFPQIINTKGDNNIAEFTAIVSLCDIVVTADTFALHVATALDKKIIAVFGPTSVNEVEIYGKGVKIESDDGCKCYYRKNCTEGISCMEKISAERVYSAINSVL